MSTKLSTSGSGIHSAITPIKASLVFLFVAFFLAFAAPAQASTLYSCVSTGVSPSRTLGVFANFPTSPRRATAAIQLGNGLSGQLRSVLVRADFSTAFTGGWYWEADVQAYTDATYSTAVGTGYQTFASNPVYTVPLGHMDYVQFDNSIATGTSNSVANDTLNPSYYYAIGFTIPGSYVNGDSFTVDGGVSCAGESYAYYTDANGVSPGSAFLPGGTGNADSNIVSGFIVLDSGSSPSVPSGIVDTTTHIASTTPNPDSTVATSTNFTLAVSGYLNNADFGGAGEEVEYSFNPVTDANVQQSIADTKVITWDIASSGPFDLATTTSVLTPGIYSFTAKIQKYAFSIFGIRFGWAEQARIDGVFTVSTSTPEEQAIANQLLRLSLFAGSGTTTQNLVNPVCGLTDFFTSSSTASCLSQLIFPSGPQIGQMWNSLYTGALSRIPFGYAVRFISLMGSSTSSVEPPPLSYTFGSSSPAELQGKTYSVQIWDNFGSSSPLLMARSDDGQNKTIWDIVMPWWDTVLALAVLLAMLSDLFGFEMGVDKTQEGRKYGALKPREKGLADRAQHQNRYGQSGMGKIK
jgi:hypothetical protein